MSECPFCKKYPYHDVDIGVGYEHVAVVCCDEGIEYFAKIRKGLDEGPPLPRHVINAQKKERAIDLWGQGHLSARKIALLIGVSHDTAARFVRGYERGFACPTNSREVEAV